MAADAARSDDRESLGMMLASVRRHARQLARAGIPTLPARGLRAAPSGAPTDERSSIEGAEGSLFSDYGAAYSARSLSELREAIGDCRRCKLCDGRTHIVFGVGNPRARIMFIGEGPGRDEDIQGEPFVGRAGQLLTDIITKGMGMKREDVYIANVVKCRPPDNRNPEPDEIEACEPFLRKQIELVGPRIIVGLGKVAVQALLRTKTPITQVRGKWQAYRGIKLMPTFHPAYLLRNPGDKKLVWEDVKKVLKELGSAAA
jgi:DNA polymerase